MVDQPDWIHLNKQENNKNNGVKIEQRDAWEHLFVCLLLLKLVICFCLFCMKKFNRFSFGNN